MPTKAPTSVVTPDGAKRCTHCGVLKPTGAFPPRRRRCRECWRAYWRAYERGHREPRPDSPDARFFALVRFTDGCWLWQGATSDGYGTFWDGEQNEYAHRFIYEQTVGPVPEGLELDHLCRTRSCVRPDHLEAVTHQENVRRGQAGQGRTHCRHGHALTPENVVVLKSGMRQCLTCRRRRGREYWRRKHWGRP